jgi:hypothetical protein
MSVIIKNEEFGEMVIPKEGKDTQALLEKYLDGIRKCEKEYSSDDGKNVYADKHNRVIVRTAIEVGWIDPIDLDQTSPKMITWLASGITDYVIDSTTVNPN